MREYKLFMDVSGDVAQEIADKSGVKLVPMDFVIGNETYTYTDRSDGIAPVDFYKYVKDRVHISTTQITPTYYEEFFDETLKQGSRFCIFVFLRDCLPPTIRLATPQNL